MASTIVYQWQFNGHQTRTPLLIYFHRLQLASIKLSISEIASYPDIGDPNSTTNYFPTKESTPGMSEKPGPFNMEDSKKKRCCSEMGVARTYLFVGFLLVSAALFYAGLPISISKKVKTANLVCNAKDGAKESYMDPYGDCSDCVPYYVTLNIFNVTNAEGHLTNNDRLQVTEIGPYVYRRREIKLNVTFTSDYLIHYKLYTYHTFEQSLSCSGCQESDKITSYDVSYLSVISAAGGETRFLYALISGTFGATWTPTQIMTSIVVYGSQMMRFLNGLNSLYPSALKTVNANNGVLAFLSSGPSAIAALNLSSFQYNGLFVTRTVKQWALGYPSILAGLALGSSYLKLCLTGGMNAKCTSCAGSDCYPIYASCKTCQQGAGVLAINAYTCGVIQQIYASENGASEAAAFAATTCGLCSTTGLCAAPMPGWAEKSGLDFSQSAPSASTLREYIQHTGCDDDTTVGEYTQFDGYTQTALWAVLDSRRNPTLAEISAFGSYGNCANKQTNTTCTVVRGSDGASIQPQGVNMMGFKTKLMVTMCSTYVGQAYTNLTLYSTGTEVMYDGMKLQRFSTPTALLSLSTHSQYTGVGYPVDGVQSLAFVNGFYVYLSNPVFLYGDASLLQGVTITMSDGAIASTASMYADGVPLAKYQDKYYTFLDYEVGTGKPMRGRKRLQANYGVAKSVLHPTKSMSDVIWPTSATEVIVPVFWGEESVTVTSEQIKAYKFVNNVVKASIPALVIGVTTGLSLQVFGLIKRRRVLAGVKPAAVQPTSK